MPYLVNPLNHSIFAPQIHKDIPARGRIRIIKSDAELFRNNQVLRVEDEKPTTERKAAATRTTAKRGGKRAEVSKAPKRETR